MNALEKLQAAIDKLETLRAHSTPAPWHHWTDDLTGDVDLWHDQEVRSHIALLGASGASGVDADAALIVTLHRTIDAQLAILREELDVAREFPKITEGSHRLALADAILGEGQS